MSQNASLLRTLYTSASGKYLKARKRLEKARQSGRFYTFSKRKQHTLVQRLNRLWERLKSLQTQLRLSGIGAAIALAMASAPAEAQNSIGPFSKEDSKNPLPPPARISIPKPATVDIDHDGDLDVFVGDKYGNIHFFRNVGGKDVVRRLVEEKENNPLDFVDLSNIVSPAFIDVDSDGDFDLLAGTVSGYTYFFRNTGTNSNPQFVEQTGSSNPFDGIYGSTTPYGSRGPALPTFADIDNDSDLDLVIGSNYLYDSKYSYAPAIQVFYNSAGTFTPGNSGVFGDLNYGSRRSLTFVDLDGDDDLDIIAGSENGNIQTFLYNGDFFVQQYGAWDPATHTGNPLQGTYLSGNTWSNLADLDNDGDLDLLVGTGYNYAHAENNAPIWYLENTGNFVFAFRNGLNVTPFGGVDVTEQATPTFTDIDDDGDIDAVLGGKYNFRLTVYKNTDGFLVQDQDDPLTDLEVTDTTLPTFVDIDDDGDKDLFVTTGYSVLFFEKDNGEFVPTASPLTLTGITEPTLAFIDVDQDGDLDALVFNLSSYEIEFFNNTGDRQNPVFTSAASPEPFEGLNFDYNTKLSAVDIDHDGDLDLIVSESSASSGYHTELRIFDNNGDGTFSEIAESPITDFVSKYSFFNMADIDEDGDLDLFVGYGESHSGGIEAGTVAFFENQNPAPVTQVTKSLVSVAYNTPVVLDPDLTISDSDDDEIVQATIKISNFVDGNEELSFTPSAGVTGEFENGELTISGKATLEEYETILRSVTYVATGDVSSARIAARGVQPLDKNVTFSVRDTDFTNTIVSVVSVISLDITGEPGLVVYNAISPGLQDDKNDYLRIEGLSSDNKVTIINRWGDKVFEVSHYDNDAHRFEGKNNNGKDLPTGTYYYQIETSGKTYSGYLSLRR
ncbi:MAG TPA: FG-GAP-like repeat-containing protein [Cyclobacteriaceae bacterium]|nr:FG-GAP-like repeat-containing protein [Cyclobacteriaceae bacterium]HMV10770.1 FG-GAP-like repeat-containing protein [Cyclobacteriaceae bacterium]HMV91477.1 FG-GAP-like repeat-containing protein [Cyclobacteriaceae bacterium]HMX01648.1 FG-GAP-like repeat-containing protein [Cyclobacteriaceae bacterium]HMX50658.1 FG-GAP-like repeat-containing protein [Cyclobacteriaceae bacterium]